MDKDSFAISGAGIEKILPDDWQCAPYCGALAQTYSTSLTLEDGKSDCFSNLQTIAHSICEFPSICGRIEFEQSSNLTKIRAESTYSESTREIRFTIDTVNPPVGGQLLIMSPLLVNSNGSRDESQARAVIRTFRGILTGIWGKTAADSLTYECLIHDKSTSAQIPTQPIEIPISKNVHKVVGDDSIAELNQKFRTFVSPELKQRAKTSFEYLGLAAENESSMAKFSFLWIALEVLTGSSGKAQEALRAILPESLANKPKELKDKRDQLFHKGIVPKISRGDELLIRTAIYFFLFSHYRVPVHGLDIARILKTFS